MIWRLLLLISLVSLGSLAAAQEEFDPLDPTDDDSQTGIPVGEKIPRFQAVDQHGKHWDFDTLKGPKGAVFLFHRSADW